MKFEQLKNWLLIGLVALSLLLTWELWTFQPNVARPEGDNLAPRETLEGGSSLSSITDVITAEKLVVVQGEESYIIPVDHSAFSDTYQRIFRSNVVVENVIGYSQQSYPIQVDQGLELIFPTAIPKSIFARLFVSEDEGLEIPLDDIDRMFIYQNPNGSNNMYIQLYSSRSKGIANLRTNIDYHMFEQNVFAIIDDFIPAIGIKNVEEEQFREQIYIANVPYEGRRSSYIVSSLDISFFQRLLFPVPNSITEIRQANGQSIYTDGSRMLTRMTGNNEEFMEFRYNVISEELMSRNIVDSSYDFINGHNGWTNPYYLADWDSLTEAEAEVDFQLRLGNLPVIMFDGQEGLMDIKVNRVGGQTSHYSRPLFKVESSPIDSKQIELPAGPEVLEFLQQNEFFDVDKIEKMLIGYEMRSRSPSYITAEPNWFILYDGRWEKVDINDQTGSDVTEEIRDELE